MAEKYAWEGLDLLGRSAGTIGYVLIGRVGNRNLLLKSKLPRIEH